MRTQKHTKNTTLIILDRDGVINFDSKHYIKSPEEWIPIPGSIEAIARLYTYGYSIAIATNQAGIAHRLFDVPTLQTIHDKLINAVKRCGGDIATIAYCPHHPDEGCTCRKPAPGLIHQIEKNLQRSTKKAWFVGDSLKDLYAAIASQCQPVLVLTGHGQETYHALKQHQQLQSIKIFDSLSTFADTLLLEE